MREPNASLYVRNVPDGTRYVKIFEEAYLLMFVFCIALFVCFFII